MSSPSRTIAWVIHGSERFGVERAIVNLVTGVTRIGWRVVIVALAEGEFTQRCRERGWHIVSAHLGMPPEVRNGLSSRVCGLAKLWSYQRRAIPKIAALLKNEKIDMLHFLWPNQVSLCGGVGRQLGVPVVWEMPNTLGRVPLRLNQRLYQRACRRGRIQPMANSAYTASTFGPGAVQPVVCHLSVDAERFDPSRVTPVSREELGIPIDAFVIAIVGRIDPSKGQDRVLEAMIALGDAARACHLLLIGDTGKAPLTGKIRDRAAQAGVTDRLHILPTVEAPECYYPAIDVAINARVDPEPFGLSVIEAMMMSKPVAVHALGGPAETVIDGVTGWHINDPSVAGWTAGLRRVFDDQPRWSAMGKAARAHGLSHFTIAEQTRRYQQLVEKLLGGDRP
ncbi:MAG: glycosyltransferase [Planctomycetes bacterium]|nr:glycosyltransferase [Planctomycetota bacterium]